MTLLLSAGLLLVHLDDIVLLHFQGLWGLVIVNAASVKQETEGGDGDADPLAVGLLEFAHLGGLLYTEMDLVGVLADNLQFDVLSVRHVLALLKVRSLVEVNQAIFLVCFTLKWI